MYVVSSRGSGTPLCLGGRETAKATTSSQPVFDPFARIEHALRKALFAVTVDGVP